MSEPRGSLDSLNRMAATLMMKTLGLRFIEAAPERVVAELPVTDALCTTPGVCHGGAIMAFADTVGAVSTFLNLPQGAGTTTLESKTNFFAAGRVGETLRAESTPLHRGKRTMAWQTRVSGEDGRLCALVTQTQMVLEPKLDPQQQIMSLFQGKTLEEQKALLAQLERGGAAMYRAWAADEKDAAVREGLLRAADREIENAETLE
jgi:uncharacterized protein (TIGR00369 family)